MDIDKRLEANRNKTNSESSKSYDRLLLPITIALIAILIGGMVFMFLQIHQLQKSVNDIDNNLPQTSCGATINDSTINCQ